MLRINKYRKAIIREAAKELRKKMVPNLDEYNEHPWKFMPEYECARSRVCKTKDEENFFEWVFIFGSERAANRAQIFLTGFKDGKRAQKQELLVHQA